MNEIQYYLNEIERLFYNSSIVKPCKLTYNLIYDDEIEVEKQFSAKKLDDLTLEDLEIWETYTFPLIWMNEKAIAYYLPHYFKLVLKNKENLFLIETVIERLKDILNKNGFSYTEKYMIYNEFNRDQREFIINFLQFISSDNFLDKFLEDEQSDWCLRYTIARIRKSAKKTIKIWEKMENNK